MLTLATVKNHRKRRVVVRASFEFAVDDLFDFLSFVKGTQHIDAKEFGQIQ